MFEFAFNPLINSQMHIHQVLSVFRALTIPDRLQNKTGELPDVIVLTF